MIAFGDITPMHQLEREVSHLTHFFDPQAKRFFRSRISDYAIRKGKRTFYFVTSERFSDSTPRLYTAHVLTRYKRKITINEIGEFQQYTTARQAWRAIRSEVTLRSEVTR